ncbi:hypothetical protein WICPIJ_003132 [Wickerhamomyces pijperi]|uniref:Uncharacterized protein n=1 Tax=Wickerhamomyces pijperi TaxID=599730 RepID=A0A9P8TP66_WICPI|nr:hypothetical protein WICPIJ_003132 [Wickerhamomyces pijperi]
MSYQPIDNPPEYTNQPPQSSLFSNGAKANNNSTPYPGTSNPNATFNDDIPDDFKYDTNVAGCDIQIRQAFARKVYTLLFVQLLATTILGWVINANAAVKEFTMNHPALLFISMILSVAAMLGAMWKSKEYPTNLILLGAFTLFEGYSIGVVTSLFDTMIVLEAMIITLVIFIGLSLFAFQTKYDFTSWVSALNGVLFAMIGVSFIWLFIQPSNLMELVYSGVGALLFSVYIVVDTQLIMRKFNVEDEIPAAIVLYLDILNLFLHILRILAASSDDN